MTECDSQEINVQVFADYFQFILEDESLRGSLEESWGEQAYVDRIAVGLGAIGVRTERNLLVPVTISRSDSEPQDNQDAWDHIAEASIDVPSSRLVISGPSSDFDAAPRFALPPGSYRLRVYYGGLDTISPDGIDGDDRYRVVLWPSEPAPPSVLKRKE